MCLLASTAGITAIALVIVNNSTKNALARFGLGCFLAQSILLHASLIHQYSRVIKCVVEANQVRTGSFQHALDVLRYNQAVIGVSVFPITGFYLYFLITLRFYWFLIPITLSLDCFLYGSIVLKEIRISRNGKTEDGGTHTTLSSAQMTSPPLNVISSNGPPVQRKFFAVATNNPVVEFIE